MTAEATELIEQKSIDQVEALWMSRLESDPREVDDFLATARLLRKAEERTRADALLELLAEALKEAGAWPERLRVLKELGRLSKKPATLRQPIQEALEKVYGGRKNFAGVLKFVKYDEPAANPVEKADKVEAALQYDEGEYFFMPGRGAGVITELNVDLGICRLDFEKDKRISVPLGAAQKFLKPLPPGHILRRKFDSPEELEKFVISKPADAFAEILRSFGRAMGMSEVRDAMTGIVAESKWSSWWTAARKHPQILVNGSGAKATYAWNESAGQAEATVRAAFDKASLRDKIDLARRHSGRNQGLADYFSSHLASEAARVAKNEPAFAWEIFAILEKLPGRFESTIDPASLLQGQRAARTVSLISDRMLRERAIATVREAHPDWPKVYAEIFFLDDEPKVLTLVMEQLEAAGATEIRDRLIDETLRYPRRHPRAFFWYSKVLNDSATIPERIGYGVLNQLLEALTALEFAPVRPRIKDFFDKGALAIQIIMNRDDEESARKLFETIDRHGTLEEYRREVVKGALMMKYPHLREAKVEPIYATPKSLAEKRAELEQLVKVEIPTNLKAIQVARELGDLSENFEYKSARARAEYLAARRGKLETELTHVRVLNPEQVDTSEIRTGTKIVLSNGDVRREVTILGPWESAPEQGVYSNQSDVANALVGHRKGDIVTFMGNDYLVESIAVWE